MAAKLQAAYLFGLFDQTKPLAGFPDGSIEILMSREDFVKAVVTNGETSRVFVIKDGGDKWICGVEINTKQ